MAPAQSKHNPTAPGAVPWADDALFHADVGPELHARLAIKPLVALLGTCKAAGDAITFKPVEARAALAGHGEWELCMHAAGKGDLWLLEWAIAQGCPWNVYTCAMAARKGQFQVLKWAIKNGCPCAKETREMAENAGLVDVSQAVSGDETSGDESSWVSDW